MVEVDGEGRGVRPGVRRGVEELLGGGGRDMVVCGGEENGGSGSEAGDEGWLVG